MLKQIKIANKSIGDGEKCFIIAEAGVNHNGELKLAKKLVDAAVNAQADAVKFQAFFPEESTSKFAKKALYQKQTTKKTESQFEMLKKLQLSKKELGELKEYCKYKNILFLCTVSDLEGADFIHSLDVDFLKVGSPDIINIPLLRHIAKWKLPIIMSTGMSGLSEVYEAVHTLKKEYNKKIVLLHCVSNYPTKYKDVNLRAMETLKKEFNCPVGFSDHTLGVEIAIAAVAMGAKVIEKHLTLDKNMEGPDHRASMEPLEFKAMIEKIKNIESALGNGIKKMALSEKEMLAKARRSLVAARDIKKGEKLTTKMLGIKKPFNGLEPKYLDDIIGKKIKKDLFEDEPITWKHIER